MCERAAGIVTNEPEACVLDLVGCVGDGFLDRVGDAGVVKHLVEVDDEGDGHGRPDDADGVGC